MNRLTNQGVFPLTWVIEQAANTNVTNLTTIPDVITKLYHFDTDYVISEGIPEGYRGQGGTMCVQSEATLKILATDIWNISREMFVRTENLQEYYAALARKGGVNVTVTGDNTTRSITEKSRVHICSRLHADESLLFVPGRGL
ncbi:PREDICTED: uncharacterized protein LOC108576574 [Habropoda laboriosa]|uniref:uncharacterized protein LOC108576574 n=1 Tax=Habropoda laboriosa TaxID=597456 RepID=UPI00083D8F89|nr:PREDICTED: uncharacterized protein LOC108576574 [Habropoda laboriosa]XP_017795078.1 PREDICTED: uncharacterized protein LOC108576574 [Habropoda laboriosa]